MPTYTPRYAFPIYDVDADPPNGPVQMRAIVEQTEAVIYARALEQSAAMTAYTPALNFQMGTINGWWKRVGGSNMVTATIALEVATGKTPSHTAPNVSGNKLGLTIGLPVNAATWWQVSGHGAVTRIGPDAGYYPFEVVGIGTGLVGMIFHGGTKTAANLPDQPMVPSPGGRFHGHTWTSWTTGSPGDRITAEITYRAGS